MRWRRLPVLNARPRKKPVYEEDGIHIRIAHRLSQDFPGLYFHHSPNGGVRTKSQAAKFKAMGTRPGFPDLIFLWPETVLHGEVQVRTGRLAVGFIELKAPGKYASTDQKLFRDMVQAAGGRWVLARSYEEVLVILLGWGAVCKR